MLNVPEPTPTEAKTVAVTELVNATLLAPELVRLIAPRNTLAALFKVMVVPPVMETAPAPKAWVMAPVWVRAPMELIVRAPVPNAVPAREVAALFTNVVPLAPVLVKVMVPSKLLVPLFRLIPPVPELMVTAPAPVWLMAPVCEMARLVEIRLNVPEPRLEVANTNGETELVSATLKAPVLLSDTAPVKLLPALARVIAKPPVVKVDVPGTTKAPVWVIAPPAVNTKLPLLLSVVAGRVIGAAVNRRLRLRKLVKPTKEGDAAAAFTFFISTSRILAKVPPKEIAPVKLLLNEDRPISVALLVAEILVVPGTVRIPV